MSTDAGASASSRSRRVALIVLRAFKSLDDSTIRGLVRTISQLDRLGLACCVFVEPETVISTQSSEKFNDSSLERHAAQQADRLVSALEKSRSIKARRLNECLGVSKAVGGVNATVKVRGRVEVQFPDLLTRSLRRGIIPVLAPIAFTESTQQMMNVDADDAVLAVVREFAGVRKQTDVKVEGTGPSAFQIDSPEPVADALVLDRVIVLDPTGAIPSSRRQDNTHIFLNMEQEYEDAREELLEDLDQSDQRCLPQHVRNLDLLRNTLALLPPSSSAMLTTPWQAATPSRQSGDASPLGVQTRRPKNPLIFNLLTDKPLVSSSLPTARMGRINKSQPLERRQQPLGATFAKRGMPLTIIPDPLTDPWRRPKASAYHMDLEDPRIDFPRLLNLIEDSFNRPLDVEHYLQRIRNKIAGIIVAGQYEGGAILTWELPPGVRDDGSESSRQRMVPYLDKFAVLKRSQGAGGVADIVFSAMVRTCFPHGVCWRSRRDNPVNKWYFERSVGTWKIPDSNWTMFWTDKDLQQGSQQWRDYEAVCRRVAPSWADNKHKLD